MRYRCIECGYIYDEKDGEEMTDTPAGTKFADLPADWACPICNVGKEMFEPVE